MVQPEVSGRIIYSSSDQSELTFQTGKTPEEFSHHVLTKKDTWLSSDQSSRRIQTSSSDQWEDRTQILTSKNASKGFHTSKNASKGFHTSKNASVFNIKGGPLPPHHPIIQPRVPTSSGTQSSSTHIHNHSNTSITQQKKVRKVKHLNLLSRQ